MEPPLYTVIRTVLERREVSIEGIQTYLQQLGSLERYDNAFNWLWFCLLPAPKDPLKASLDEISDALVNLNSSLPNQARNAYAACLLIPGLEQLTFHPLLQKFKKLEYIQAVQNMQNFGMLQNW